MTYKEKPICNSSPITKALATENAFSLAVQQGWWTIEIWADSLVLIHSLLKENAIRVGISSVIDQCICLKERFLHYS